MKNILIINAGSSSIKYQLINMEDEQVILKGMVERIGCEESTLSNTINNIEKIKLLHPIENHSIGIKLILETVENCNVGEILAIGHRVVHGGSKYFESVIVDDQVMNDIRHYAELAPAHNPANAKGIEICMQLMPGIPNVAVFDTAFHQTIPEHAYIYGLSREVYEKYQIRKYGFHGISHRFITQATAQLLERDLAGLKIISCHLGNGCSVAAVKDGACIDTSMGLTPLEGLIMGTRSGDLDPAVFSYLMDKMNMSAQDVLYYLNNECGVKGISGISNDFRDLHDACANGNKYAKLALDAFYYRVIKHIGSYVTAMGGVDVISFTGGIGENDVETRYELLSRLECIGVKIDRKMNQSQSKQKVISTFDSKLSAVVIETNEEMMIARDAYDLVGSKI